MRDSDALVWLAAGLAGLDSRAKDWRRRQDYVDGDQDLPYTPEGTSEEHLELRKQSRANILRLVRDAPVQRLSVVGIDTGKGDDVNKRIWGYWQQNKLDSRQELVNCELVVHARGIKSVWPTVAGGRVVPGRPIIRPESSLNVHLEPDPDDLFSTLYAVKRWRVKQPTLADAAQLTMGFRAGAMAQKECAVVYDHDSFQRFERRIPAGGSDVVYNVTTLGGGGWEKVDEGTHPMTRVPFVAYDDGPLDDRTGQPKFNRSWIAQLMPAQDGINTIRYFILASLQYSGFRQRIISGYDAVLRDLDGNPVYRLGGDGQPVIDPQTGRPIPVLVPPGRFGVDRAITFNSPDTKVYDLQESDLEKQVGVLQMFVDDVFVRGQVPPQYALDKMANMNGAGGESAEGIYQSRLKAMQRSIGEADEELLRLAAIAAGDDGDDLVPPDAEMQWAQTQQRAYQEVTDGVSKLAAAGLPRSGWMPMVPDATAQKVRRWQQDAETEQQAAAEPVKSLAASIRERAAAATAAQQQ